MEKVTKENLQIARQQAPAIWTEYIYDYKRAPDKYFVFYEGKDRYYYNHRLKKYTTNYNTYEAGGKSNVIKVYNKIKEEGEDQLKKKLFFIDKDYEKKEDLLYGSDVYVTDSYSIENYYVSKSSLQSILTDHFGVNSTNLKFSKITNYFDERYREFMDYLTELNLWAIACKLEGVKVDFSLLNLQKSPSKILSVTYEKVEPKEEGCSLSFFYFLNDYCEKLKQAKDEKYENDYSIYTAKQEAIEICFKENMDEYKINIIKYFRGKFIIWFFVEFIKSLTQKRKPVLERPFEINDRNVLSVLSAFAETPEELEEYLKRKIYE